jgi:hypothetical protein
VPLESELRVIAIHADSVIADAHQSAAALFEVDVDRRRPGVERVFEQFLDHRRGSLHDLAGRDLIRYIAREHGYPRQTHSLLRRTMITSRC